jgi:hypothetical protein
VILLRETGCERAFAMVSAGTNLDALETAIAADTSYDDSLPLQSGEGALSFGQVFENTILRNKAEALVEALTALFTDDPRFRASMKGGEFSVVASFSRGAEGTETGDEKDHEGSGNFNVWRATSKLIEARAKDHEGGAVILHGVLKIPKSARDWYLVPDVLVSPPGYPYYIPFEIKSYEKMAHLTEDHHIASASVQSCLYLYALMHGHGDHGPYPEAAAPRDDERTGIVFRINGTMRPDPMLVAGSRDLVAIERILGGVEPDPDAFLARFGRSYADVAAGNLVAIEHIASTLSDSCVHACRMAARCRDIAKTHGLLRAYGDNLARAYSEYQTVGQVGAALRGAHPKTADPNLARMLAVETEIERLLAGVLA